MTRFSRLEVLTTIIDLGLVPLFDTEDVDTAERIITACVDGGARVVEFRKRREQSFLLFSDLVRRFAGSRPDVIIGVGSVIDAPTAALYLACGANFVVSPVLNPEVARVCNRQKVAYLPGCGSASEISNAEELGVEDLQDLPGQRGRRAEFRQVSACALTLVAAHAHGGRGRDRGERQRVDEGRRMLSRHGLKTRDQGDGERGGHRDPGPDCRQGPGVDQVRPRHVTRVLPGHSSRPGTRFQTPVQPHNDGKARWNDECSRR